MAFQPVPDTASFRMLMTGEAGTTEIVNTIHVRNESVPWTSATLSAMAATIGNAWRDEIMPLLASECNFNGVDARDLGVEFGQQSFTVYDTDGGKAAPFMTASACALAKLTCASGGAPRQGHLFISQLAETDFSGSFVATQTRADIVTALETIDGNIQGGGNAWVVVSRYETVGPPEARVLQKRNPALTNEIVEFTVRFLMGTQRDRRPGIGS